MNDFWLNLGISAVLQALYDSVKNPVSKAKLKPAMLKIAATIHAIWADDKSFQDMLDARVDYQKAKLGL